jgi:hypothetical protein
MVIAQNHLYRKYLEQYQHRAVNLLCYGGGGDSELSSRFAFLGADFGLLLRALGMVISTFQDCKPRS